MFCLAEVCRCLVSRDFEGKGIQVRIPTKTIFFCKSEICSSDVIVDISNLLLNFVLKQTS